MAHVYFILFFNQNSRPSHEPSHVPARSANPASKRESIDVSLLVSSQHTPAQVSKQRSRPPKSCLKKGIDRCLTSHICTSWLAILFLFWIPMLCYLPYRQLHPSLRA